MTTTEPTGDTQAPARSRVVEWGDPIVTAAGMSGRTGLEFLQTLVAGELPPPPILATIGAALESVEAGKVVFTLDPAEYHYNPIGSVHGGVYATLLDSAMGCAVQSMLPEQVGYTSLDLSVKFLGAIRLGTGRVTCTGTVVHLGRRTALAEGTLTTQDGKLLATGTSSCLILGG
ncbi:PaaI family thioesterase [Jatrophihabitans sp.]|uniref:PaaI family thioesterase n=1 Tax=Jatrophihabitans sp. TaxID=1932789 RepID=UPI0030C72665|nr:Thioesterase superfamily protein [Jatrophihabitans sp.]